MKRGVAILLFLCFAIEIQSQSTKISPVKFPNLKDFGGAIKCIFQDKTGFIWVGRENGLFRYDGNEWKVFRYEPSDTTTLGGNHVLAMTEDSSGNLWICTKGGGLNFYNRASGKFTRYLHKQNNANSISYNDVCTIIAFGSNKYLIGTDGGGLTVLDVKSQRFKSLRKLRSNTGKPISDKIIMLEHAPNGCFWVATWGDGLYLFNPLANTIQHIGSETQYAKSNVCCVKEITPGVLWVATWGQGLFSLDIRSGQFTSVIDPSVIANFYDFQISKNGDVWLTSNAGLVHFPPSKMGYEVVKSVSSDFTNTSRTLIDRTNNVWVGCYNGNLGKINSFGNPFFVIPSWLPIGKSAVNAVLADSSSNNVYFSSGNSLVLFNPSSNKYKTYPLAASDIVSIADMPGQQSLLCAIPSGLYLFNKKTEKFTKLAFEEGYNEVISRSVLYISPVNRLLYNVAASGIAYQIFYNEQSGLWKVQHVFYVEASRNLSFNHNPTSFLYDKDQGFWIGSLGGGLNRLKPGESHFTNLTHDVASSSGLCDNFVECLANDRNGNILVGTRGGLSRYNLQTSLFSQFNMANGLANDWVQSVTADSKNNIWLSTQKGISTISADGKYVKNYDSDDGLPDNFFRARSIATDRAGTIYFGSNYGLVWFHPDSIRDNPALPTSALVDFKINNESVPVSASSPLKQSIELTREIELTHNQSAFSFQMAALGYFNSKKNRIKYKLEGYDKDWILAGIDQRAVYSGVSSGSYHFMFCVANEDGVWNAAKQTIKITIAPPLWLSAWAIVLYFTLAGGAIAFYFYVARKRKLIIAATIAAAAINRNASPDLIQLTKVNAEPAEKEFLQKVLTIVEANIDDADFGVEQLCDKMHLSQSQLYRRINAIVGVSISEFIREVRLKKAAQLILQNSVTISEVAYLVGFNDPKYFSKCFKQYFGVTPKQYAASK